MNTPVLVGGIVLAVAGLGCVLAALVVLLGRRRRRRAEEPAQPQEVRLCAECHQPLPQGATACPVCSKTPAEAPAASAAAAAAPSAEGAPEQPSRTDGTLVGLTGPRAQQVFEVQPAPRGLTIGRNADNDVVISDMLISRYHAQVMPEGDAFVLYDRNSANGTLVNGQRVYRHELKDGDVVQLCSAHFAFSRAGQPAAQTPPPAEPAPQKTLLLPLNTPFEGYMLETLLGEGGISVVYKASAPDGTPVAIKILNVTDDYIVHKFIQEQQIGEVLAQHPYIRKVYSLGHSQEHMYLVMEYVEGRSLRRMVGKLPDAEIVRIIGQTCQALAYAHERRIVHRDVKPENILVAQDGMVKVTDFGIAKLTSAVTVTRDRVVGTPEYLSPEQARGDETIEPSADIYSLGIVLYELLAGQVPFPLAKQGDPYREAVTVLGHHIHTPPPAPRERNPQVNSALEKVALKALEKDPRKRYRSALAMAEALGYREPPPALEAAVSVPVLPVFSLLVTRGARAGQRFEVKSENVVMGRADLDPQDILVSRRHMLLAPRGGQLWLQDTSLNGTCVNGQRVFGEVLLKSGDEIEIGQSALCVEERA